MKQEEAAMEKLPLDSIESILMKLPGSALQRFRLVCKSWLALLSEPNFEKRSGKYHEKLFLVFDYIDSFYTLTLPVAETDDDGGGKLLTPLGYPPGKPYCLYEILGSCHGLVCLCYNHGSAWFLLNPTTSKYKQLPLPCPAELLLAYSYYGFGYEESSKDFKLLKKNTFPEDDITPRLYSLKTNSWKSVSFEGGRDVDPKGAGIYLNGASHWPVAELFYQAGLYFDHYIVAFKFAEEEFCSIPLPDYERSNRKIHYGLGVVDGCLCVASPTSVNGVFELWKMCEYGVKQSWTVFMAIDVRPIVPGFHDYGCVFKFGLSMLLIKNDKVLFQVMEKGLQGLVWFDAGSNTFKSVAGIDDIPPPITLSWNRSAALLNAIAFV